MLTFLEVHCRDCRGLVASIPIDDQDDAATWSAAGAAVLDHREACPSQSPAAPAPVVLEEAHHD